MGTFIRFINLISEFVEFLDKLFLITFLECFVPEITLGPLFRLEML